MQATNSKNILYIPEDYGIELRLILQNEDQTFGGAYIGRYRELSRESRIVDKSWNFLQDLDQNHLVDKAKDILSIIQDSVLFLTGNGIDLSHLPQLEAFNVDDGSLLIEWLFEDFRIGFSLEINISESNWYLVTNQKLGEINASGYLSDTKKTVLWLLNFIISNH